MITWSIDKITTVPQVGDHSDVVKQIDWRCTANIGETSQSTYGKVILTLDESSFEDFTEYNDLSEEQVIGWVKETLGEQGVSYQQLLAERRTIELANPSLKVANNPW